MTRYQITTYTKATERVTWHMFVPLNLLEEIKQDIELPTEDDGLRYYMLDDRQASQVGRILDFHLELDKYYYCFEPYESTDDE